MKKILLWLDKNLEEVFMGSTMIVMFVVLFGQTVRRYVFNTALNWPEELSRFVFIWYVFVGMAYCERYHTHLIVDFLTAFFPKLNVLYGWVGDFSVLAFSCVMAYFGIDKLQALIKSGQLSPAMEFPMWIAYLALEVGFVLCIFRAVQSIVLRFMNLRKGAESK